MIQSAVGMRTSAAERRIYVGDVAPRLASSVLPTSRCLHPKPQTVQLTAKLLDDPISRGNEDIRRGASDLRGRRRSATRVLGLVDLALFASLAIPIGFSLGVSFEILLYVIFVLS